MLVKQKWVFLALLLILYPVTVYSQVSFKKLPVGGTGFGFEFSPQEDITSIGARIDYGFNINSKISVSGAIGFTDDDYLESYVGDVSPITGIGMSVLHIQSLGQSELEYFLQGGFTGAFFRIVDNVSDNTIINSRSFALTGGGGILKRLRTESEWVLIPFFALTYSNVWVTVENTLLDYEETVSDGSFGGTTGIEIQLSQKMSVIGSFDFSFESSDTLFSIGLNFN